MVLLTGPSLLKGFKFDKEENGMTFRLAALGLAMALIVSPVTTASAIEAYSDATNQQFTDWCTGEKSQSEGVCSCTLKSVARTVPAAALTTYLSGLATGQATSLGSLAVSGASTTAVAVTQAMVSCSG